MKHDYDLWGEVAAGDRAGAIGAVVMASVLISLVLYVADLLAGGAW